MGMLPGNEERCYLQRGRCHLKIEICHLEEMKLANAIWKRDLLLKQKTISIEL